MEVVADDGDNSDGISLGSYIVDNKPQGVYKTTDSGAGKPPYRFMLRCSELSNHSECSKDERRCS